VSREAAPHETSLAVWDIPSPLPLGGSAKVKVGLRCAAGCPLTGQKIEIRDDKHKLITATKLGSTPWPGTLGLYWAEADLVAPFAEGTHVWTAQFSPSGLEMPHLASSLTFSLTTAKPPEHTVTVEVLQKDTHSVVDSAEVRLEVYRTLTNENGIACLEVPRGTYQLNVWKMGYEFATRNLEVNSDQSLTVELPVEPEPSPFGES
jgi:hypothetical protein